MVEGEPYATAHQLARLETIVQNQQIHIDLLEKERNLFQQGIETYLSNQQDAAAAARGSKGQDVIVVTKYVSTCIQRAIQQIQTDVAKQIKDSLPMKQVQELERRLVSRPYSNEEVGELIHRISQLESQVSQGNAHSPSPIIHEIHGPTQEQIESLQQHIHHLETNLIKEVQRAHQTTYKPGDYGTPLGKLQVDVDTLKREMKSMKILDGQTLAENIMKTALANVRTEFQTALEKKASSDELEAFREQVARTEVFLRKLQTAWGSVSTRYEEFRETMSEQFSEKRWNQLAKQVLDTTEQVHKNMESDSKQLVATQTLALDEMLEWNRSTLKKLYESVKQHTSQDRLEQNYLRIQTHLLSRFEPAIETIRQHLNQQVALLETNQKINRQQQLAFISEVKSVVSASELEKQYTKFEERLADQKQVLEETQTRQDQYQIKSKQILQIMKQIQNETEQQVQTVEKDLANLQNKIQTQQSETRATLDTWCQQRKTQFDSGLNQYNERLQTFQDQVYVAQQSLQLTVDSRKQFEEKQIEGLNQVKQTLQKKLEEHEKDVHERVSGRLAELSGPIRTAMKEVTEQQAEVNHLLSEQSITEFVRVIETRIKKEQDDWQRIRSSELHEAISFFGTKLTNMDQTLQTELSEQRTIVQTLQTRLGDRYRRELSEMRDKYAQIRPLIQRQILESLKQYKNVSSSLIRSLPTWFDTAPKCFYTAIMGAPGQKVDSLASVDRIPGWDYICFTNKPIHNSKGWTIVRVDMPNGSAALDAKRYKWRSIEHLSEYEIVVWVDGYISPDPAYRQLLERWVTNMKETGHSMLFRPHDQRVCIWEECEAVIEAKRDTPLNVEKVRTKLKHATMPKDWGLFDTNCMVLFHRDSSCRKLTEAVWNQLETISVRDQLALPLCLYEQKPSAAFKTETLMRAFTKSGQHVIRQVE